MILVDVPSRKRFVHIFPPWEKENHRLKLFHVSYVGIMKHKPWNKDPGTLNNQDDSWIPEP